MSKGCHKKIVLVIEDDADCRNFASRVLELEGYCVLQAENGDEGLRLVRESGCSHSAGLEAARC